MKSMKTIKNAVVIIIVMTIKLFGQSELLWSETAPGVWKAAAGTPDKFNFYSAINIKPAIDAMKRMPDASFPINQDEIKSVVADGKTYLRFPLDKDEKIFGLGLNFKTVEQRGRIMRLHVDHYGGEDNGRTHAPVPFYVSSKGYGVLINSARYIDIWVGTAVRKESKNPPAIRDRNSDRDWEANPYSDNVEILIPANGAEVFIFGGPTMLDVVRRYNLFNGGGSLPPKWGLGFWQRTPTLYTEKDVLNEVKEYNSHKFPLTVIGLEPGWQSKSYPCSYEWDKSRFPDPVRLIDSLRNRGVFANLWINPYISPDSKIYNSMLPYTSSHTVWAGVVPDYSLSYVREIIGKHFMENIINKGVSGFKMDENDGFDEWLWPDVALFPSGNSAEQMRQTYALMMQQLTLDLYKSINRRTYGLIRGSNAGASSFPYVIYNDYYSHRDFITALVNSSFCGVLWTPEVRSSKNGEEWLRRMQTVCFSPLAMINAWADGTKPWSFPEVEKQVLEIADLRMQLIPYLYTAFADYAFNGTPPFRAMNLEPGFNISVSKEKGILDSENNPYEKALRKEIKDQYMVGEFLLVAPFFAGEKARQVVLPKGKWYDFFSGRLIGESEVITVKMEDDKMPLFVKEGGIIPMAPAGIKQFNEKVPVEIRVYGNTECSYLLYDDDGETYDYENGEYIRIKLSVGKDEKGAMSGRMEIPSGRKAWSYSGFSWKFMTEL